MFLKSKERSFIPYLTLIVFCILTSRVSADEIHLKNNDRISGEILGENKDSLSVKTEATGVISVKKEFIDRVIKPEAAVKEDKKKEKQGPPLIIWQKEFSLGYNTARGNTRKEQFSLNALVNKNRKCIDEWTFKGNFFYSEANKKLDSQKWYAMGRYAFSFGLEKDWYDFYRLEADHDKFAGIYSRLIPSTGVGYWFFDLPESKFLSELALGLEHTDYYGGKKDSSNFVAVPRLFYEQELFKRAKFSQDICFYPALTDSGVYRIHSESAFTLSINDSLGLRLSLIDDYNSNSQNDTKKNDLNFVSALVYSFK